MKYAKTKFLRGRQLLKLEIRKLSLKKQGMLEVLIGTSRRNYKLKQRRRMSVEEGIFILNIQQ